MGGWFARFRRGGGDGSHEQPRRSSQPSRVTEQDKAVHQLKVQRDTLKKYQEKINIQLVKEREVAKRLLREGKREKAKLLLKKKRYFESTLEKTDQQLENLQGLVDNIEYAQVEMKVVDGLKQGNECLKQMHKLMSIEDVERIMEETQESIEYQREIDELLGQNLTQEDEDAIAEELESIILSELPEPHLEDEDITTQLPDVPSAEPERAPAAAQKEKRQAVAA